MPRILVVDDELELATNIADILKQEGFEAETADLSDAVVDALVANPPDLVLLDAMAPGDASAGFTIARTIRRTEAIKDLPIIMLSAVNDTFPLKFSSKDIDGNWMPVQDFIEKSGDPAKLVARIRELLAS